MTGAIAHERRLVRLREVMAGGDEKRSAPHRRIDDAQREDVARSGVPHERAKGRAGQIIGNRLRRIERAGGFPDAGPGDETNRIR